MSLTAVIMIIYIVIVKPQKERIMMNLTALGESIILFLHLFSILFLDNNLEEEKINNYGWFILIIIGLYVVLNWVIIITITI